MQAKNEKLIYGPSTLPVPPLEKPSTLMDFSRKFFPNPGRDRQQGNPYEQGFGLGLLQPSPMEERNFLSVAENAPPNLGGV
jgi:hypothetical protein